MKDGTFLKVVQSGHVVEVWEYERMSLPSKSRAKRIKPTSEEQKKKNQRLAMFKFMRLVNQNFDSGSKFATFTFRDGVLEDVSDVLEANRYWDRFIKRLRRKYGDFRWVVTVQFQDKNGRGAVHYHMIADLPFISSGELESIWQYGFVKINRIEHVDNVGAYVSRYMIRDACDERLRGLKSWRGSQNMQKPLELRGDEARDLFTGVWHTDAVYQSEYESDYNGKIVYRQYNLER